MKTDELKLAIRTLVRTEVKKLIKEEMRILVIEEVNRAMGKALVEAVREIKTSAPIRQPVITEEVEESEEIREVIHTKNPKLSRALAETARFSPKLPRTNNLSAGLADLMEGEFEQGVDEDLGIAAPKAVPKNNMDFLKQIVGESVVPQTRSVLDSPSQVPDVLKGVFKKDFRAIMKKMDEVKKNGPSILVG
jgi:hypothetical protein